MPDQNTLTVTILNPDKILYSGPAQAVSSRNKMGKFDILPQHTRFISIIEKKLTVHIDPKKKQTFTINQGIVRCYDNMVQIYL